MKWLKHLLSLIYRSEAKRHTCNREDAIKNNWQIIEQLAAGNKVNKQQRPDFKELAAIAREIVQHWDSDYKDEMAKDFTEALEAAYTEGFNAGVDASAEYVNEYSTAMGDEIKALKENIRGEK